MITATRYHDISCGHRVHGHEGKCANLHGHNYRVHFTIAGEQDEVGRVLDFSVIKDTLCEWLEDYWDHRMLIWFKDPLLSTLKGVDPTVVTLPFNPTAENMADFLLTVIAPRALLGTGATLIAVKIEETAKCSAEASL
jgi:6-pyruvoyltetrahydropterin/6-carboxytetrahydropterin synthase